MKRSKVKQEVKEKPQRNEKGQFLIGNKESAGLTNSGRPCEFCKDKSNYLEIAIAYLLECKGQPGDKPKYPSIAELAVKLNTYRQKISEWEGKLDRKGNIEHPEFADYVKKVRTLQFIYLENNLLTVNNPTGSIFLMKTQHDQIETEKKILAGSNKEPLEIVITEEAISERLDNE